MSRSHCLAAIACLAAVPSLVLAGGYYPRTLRGEYPLDADATDLSTWSNHGKIAGATGATGRGGAANGALDFDGANDFVVLSNEQNFDLDALTISLFIRPESLPLSSYPFGCGKSGLVSKGNDGGTFSLYFMHCGGASYGELQFLQDAPGGNWGTSARSWHDVRLNPNQWHHVAVTRTTMGTVKLFVNGALKRSVDGAPDPIMNGDSVRVGTDVYGRYFNGRLDELTIYSRALGDDEVADLANGIIPPF